MTNEELVEKIQSKLNVQENLSQLYIQNKPFIYKLALPYAEYVDIDDLMQEAYFGLLKAATDYKSELGFKFITYASSKIRSVMQRYCYNNSLTKKIPIHILELIRKYHRIRKDYYIENDEYPSEEYIIQQLNIPKKRLQELQILIQNTECKSMSDIIPGTEDVSLEEYIADDNVYEDNVVDTVTKEKINKLIWETVDALDGKSSNVIKKHYKYNVSEKDIAKEMNVSPAWIRQIKLKAQKQLKEKSPIKEAAEFYGYECNCAFHFGLQRFKNTMTSCVELIAIKHITAEERERKYEYKG